jgi:hypothetical protein
MAKNELAIGLTIGAGAVLAADYCNLLCFKPLGICSRPTAGMTPQGYTPPTKTGYRDYDY